MTDDTPQDLIDMLDDLLDEERSALVAGDLERIGRIVARKESLVDALNRIDAMQAQDIAGLQEKFRRNQSLLNEALAGIRAVSQRMTALRRVRASLDTYDSNGRRQSFADAQIPSVERRA
ncbi:MAG: flagellar export chaperone FlgN [Rhodobacteraceae bacterium]|nr:flagellar export chaperone FlgN [Paracoccaceae bacterium]